MPDLLDLVFPALGQSVPTDHAYPLYAALSRSVPAFHDPDSHVRFAPLTGTGGEPGRLRLTDRSRLRVRLPADAIGTVLPLAGRAVEVAGSPVRFGPPTVLPLTPAASLFARVVVIKGSGRKDKSRERRYTEVGPFLEAVRARLTALGVNGEVTVPERTAGPRAGEPVRRVVRVKGRAMVGYAVVVSGLTADDSLRLQEHGLGGRTRLGCGFFLPARW